MRLFTKTRTYFYTNITGLHEEDHSVHHHPINNNDCGGPANGGEGKSKKELRRQRINAIIRQEGKA